MLESAVADIARELAAVKGRALPGDGIDPSLDVRGLAVDKFPNVLVEEGQPTGWQVVPLAPTGTGQSTRDGPRSL
jgi:hypothetical protein